jgi:predicted AlkP superfamily pyrophosphatase or phosphodiesterase
MRPTLVVLVVGLSPNLIGEYTPNIRSLVRRGAMRPLKTVTPAVTCTVQATLATGLAPSGHGAVANGWYFRNLSEVWLWRQSNRLIGGEKIWEAAKAKNSDFTCAKMFWWYNMYASADWGATPRPQYPADGRKIPDHYAYPSALRDELNAKLGMFPLFKFWGPATDCTSSEWIARATMHVMETRDPTLALCYLPHLDYNLQRLGPDLADPRMQQDLQEVDAVCGELIAAAERQGRDVIVVSEYGITKVSDAVHINRALREAGFLALRVENGRELLDAGMSKAFAVADHQCAHIYVQDASLVNEVRDTVLGLEGVEQVLDTEGKREHGLDHPRSGELVAIAHSDRWFSYYYWLDDDRAPDFARTVDIHRKPGYDPVELFIDSRISWPMLKVGAHLLRQKLGMRSLLEVVSLQETARVRGSHGRLTEDPADGPLVISSRPDLLARDTVEATGFKQLVLDHVFGI